MAASRAAFYLSKNNDNLQNSLNRLSSGKQITKSYDDAGGLAVSMKLEGSIDRLKGASNNISNAISFLQVQDGLLESAANIVSRMGELKGLYADVLKSSSDQDTYDSEFNDLQGQLLQLTTTKFNGVDLFSNSNTHNFDTIVAASTGWDTETVYISEDGSSGASVEIHKSLLQSAVTFADGATTTKSATTGVAADEVLAQASSTESLADYSTAQLTKALENIATLRANNGGQVSRLQYAQENLQSQTTNLQAAVGRIVDVDIASETAELAKQQILVQASASMVAQANTANNVALMLLQ
jgi:flagellin